MPGDRTAHSDELVAVTRAEQLQRDEPNARALGIHGDDAYIYSVEYDPQKPQAWRVVRHRLGIDTPPRRGPVPLNAPRLCTYVANPRNVYRLPRIRREPADDHVIATLRALIA